MKHDRLVEMIVEDELLGLSHEDLQLPLFFFFSLSNLCRSKLNILGLDERVLGYKTLHVVPCRLGSMREDNTVLLDEGLEDF